MLETIKSLFYCVTVLSCLGIVFFLRRNLKACIAFILILLFCVFWRSFSFSKTSRYYSVLIFSGVFLSAYAVNCFIHLFRTICVQRIIVLLLTTILLCLHLGKTFSSYKNNYILDLQDRVDKILTDEHKSDIHIYEREFQRIGRNKAITNMHVKILPSSNYNAPTDLYIKNGSFSNNMYLIVSNEYSSFIASKPFSLFEYKKKRYSEVEHFVSNAGHTKYLSVYRHFPYVPTPDLDDNQIINHAVLKAFIPEYDAFIYQAQDKMIWLIGAPIDTKTEIIYHIYTDQPELLPSYRIQYKYDNWGFRVNSKNEREKNGKYRMFEKNIPTKYHITLIRTGFNTEGKIIWRDFYLSQ